MYSTFRLRSLFPTQQAVAQRCRAQWALRDLKQERQISVGTAGPQREHQISVGTAGPQHMSERMSE